MLKFLDTFVYKTPAGKLETKPDKNETDREAYLHRRSGHPNSFRCNIVLAQTLCLQRISTATRSTTAVDTQHLKFRA